MRIPNGISIPKIRAELLNRLGCLLSPFDAVTTKLTKILDIGSKVPDWKALQTHLVREGRIKKEHFVRMLHDVIDIFSKL